MFNEYIKGDSIIHRIDPRVKIIYTLVFSIVIALQNELIPVLTGLAISIILVAIAGIEIKEVIQRLRVVDEFILLLWLILPFTYPGEPIIEVWNFSVSKEGIMLTTLMTIKANAIMLILTGLLATSSIFELVHGLLHLKIPEKLVFMFFLIYRYIWVLYDEYEKIMRAVKARGFRLHNTLHTYRTIAYIVGGLLVKSYNRADNLYRAMVCRGFNGKFWLLEHFKFSTIDLMAIIMLTTGNIVIIIL
ncbi:MAG: cobalt ECF transporter T component CbiQ [candidate division WOR-3 bacterium]|nr:cobalt ECF transporter T component CbiQ [candidate division WOR-3 bacterium]